MLRRRRGGTRKGRKGRKGGLDLLELNKRHATLSQKAKIN
jgi:hypothetical protein